MNKPITGSNPTDTALAGALTELGSPEKGTLALLQIHKKGVTRGSLGSKMVYDDDVVEVLLWSGFLYRNLAERSHGKLHQLWSKGDLTARLIKESLLKNCEVTIAEASEVIQEVEESLLKVINSTGPVFYSGDEHEHVDSEISQHCWETLVVKGQIIRGSKVYVGEGDPDDPRAPVPGTIYIDGVKLGEKIIVQAPNGHWKTNQRPKTVAKDILRSWLPIGLYVRYCLEKERLIGDPLVGEEAAKKAKADGIPIDPESLRQLFKLVP
ncbi:MAG: hypothetical protein WC824_15295 [Bacteroidota bacterium]|jgi:hypothetical protein